MPQMDKEVFIEYFSLIFIVLLHFHSDFMVSENFFRINARFFLLNSFKKKKFLLNKEISFIQRFYNNLSLSFIKR
jgi:hypothetical protein